LKDEAGLIREAFAKETNMSTRWMVVVGMLLAPVAASFGQSGGTREVAASETTVSMPTSLMGSPRPNTLFLGGGSSSEDVYYPQSFFGYLLREKPVDRDWRMEVLENQYLRASSRRSWEE
jgi:hypothetical protein